MRSRNQSYCGGVRNDIRRWHPFAERARIIIKRGYTPKVAVELVLHEMEFEYGVDSRKMEKARTDAEDFLAKVRKGLI